MASYDTSVSGKLLITYSSDGSFSLHQKWEIRVMLPYSSVPYEQLNPGICGMTLYEYLSICLCI